MATQAVNTEGITFAADKLHDANSYINFIFGSLQTTVKSLGDWRGVAGESARDAICQIFKGNDARDEVMKNYIEVLNQVVNPGYIETENKNRTLADQFK
ncbi:MAG: hypothetical protein FWG34_10230 [Oscillospiraceae bacterium]|nr:hypothetical protein [Oscillospiraceae bacterium]